MEKEFIDLLNKRIRLTEDRWKHIKDRPEMIKEEDKIKETLSNPELLKRSVSSENVVIYYKHYPKTQVTSKHLAVVVNTKENFIISAYFTDRIKKGELVWKRD